MRVVYFDIRKSSDSRVLTWEVHLPCNPIKMKREFQEYELPHKKSNRKGYMPQNKNLTQICFSEAGVGKQNGVIYAREKGA
jgi:hypothetical protein